MEPKWLVEKYISAWTLPREQIIGYVKWKPGLEYTRIKIKMEADVLLYQAINVDDKVFQGFDPGAGFLNIPRENVQIDGFIGFQARYENVPGIERPLRFVIEFEFPKGGRENIELATQIIRPLARLRESTPEILVSDELPPPKYLSFVLLNEGQGEVKEGSLVPYFEISKAKGLEINVATIRTERKLSDRIFVKSNELNQFQVSIKGKGNGVIGLGFQYKDRVGNDYRLPLSQILVTVKDKSSFEIPISDRLEGVTPLVLEPVSR